MALEAPPVAPFLECDLRGESCWCWLLWSSRDCCCWCDCRCRYCTDCYVHSQRHSSYWLRSWKPQIFTITFGIVAIVDCITLVFIIIAVCWAFCLVFVFFFKCLVWLLSRFFELRRLAARAEKKSRLKQQAVRRFFWDAWKSVEIFLIASSPARGERANLASTKLPITIEFNYQPNNQTNKQK